jgi:hypothetical protein
MKRRGLRIGMRCGFLRRARIRYRPWMAIRSRRTIGLLEDGFLQSMRDCSEIQSCTVRDASHTNRRCVDRRIPFSHRIESVS